MEVSLQGFRIHAMPTAENIPYEVKQAIVQTGAGTSPAKMRPDIAELMKFYQSVLNQKETPDLDSEHEVSAADQLLAHYNSDLFKNMRFDLSLFESGGIKGGEQPPTTPQYAVA